MQFELDCRPFYVAGFNAHDLMPKALATPEEHKTTGGQPKFQMKGTSSRRYHGSVGIV